MKYSICPKVFALNPKLHFGILVGKNLQNSESTEADVEMLREMENKVRNKIKEEELRSIPVIMEYRNTMERAGINPNKYSVSTEAMIKRVLKGNNLPSINALVDLCNVVSLENQISLGGHDLRDIKEDLSVRFSTGDEKFLPFGLNEYEAVDKGELIFTSGSIVQTRKWIWRQSELGKVTLDTRNVFFQLVGFGEDEENPLTNALDSLEKLITERFGGTCERYIVNADNPDIEFDF